jgi:ABC-2 type transport system permease protein
MATQTLETPRRAGRHRAVPDRSRRPVGRSVARLTARLIRWRTLAICLGLGGYMLVEGVAYDTAYPDPAARAALKVWGQEPSFRIIAGPPTAVDTVGGFAVWDAGLYLVLIIGAWTLTTTTRVLRGDEAAGRTELLLAGPIRAQRLLYSQLLVLLGACLAIGTSIALGLVAAGAEGTGSVLFGAAMAGYAAALVGIATLASQVFPTRGAALGSSGIVLLLALVLRMVANSADSRAWLGWLSPVGWSDQLRAFGDNRWPVLLVPAGITAALLVVSAWVRRRRDSGASLLGERREHRSRALGLGGPTAFAWRMAQPVLIAWAAGIAVAGAVASALVPAAEDLLRSDAGMMDMLSAMGIDIDNLIPAFIGMWGTMLGVAIAVYTAFRMGAARAEEDSTRAEFLLTRPVRRSRWLGGHVVCVIGSVLVLSGIAALSIWLAAVAAGADVGPGDAFLSVFNATPVVAVFAGVAVLVFGLAPRLTVAVAATVAVVAYVVELVGPLLNWPDWVVSVSPYHHVAAVPVEPFAWAPALVMLAVAGVLALAGIVAFERRDLVGA